MVRRLLITTPKLDRPIGLLTKLLSKHYNQMQTLGNVFGFTDRIKIKHAGVLTFTDGIKKVAYSFPWIQSYVALGVNYPIKQRRIVVSDDHFKIS